MGESVTDALQATREKKQDPNFPHAPDDWSRSTAEGIAVEAGLELNDDHWEAIRALQEYFAKHDECHVRELHDALDEKFHAKGGLKYLYALFPGGPVAQGCRIAGLQAPAGSADPSFGSVQ